MAALAVAWASPALAVPNLILNGEFGSDASPLLTSWTVGSGTANARASTDTINTSTGNAGFDSFFTSPTEAFAVLGDEGGDISDVPRDVTSSISQTFTLPLTQDAISVLSWSITVSFKTVFDGKNAGTSGQVDTFQASLPGIAAALFTQNSSTFPSCDPAPLCSSYTTGTQLTQAFSSMPYTDLTPGTTYTLTFSLAEHAAGADTESGERTNTAVGIDSVSILGTPTLATVSEPTTLLLWGLTAVGLGLMLRKTGRRL